MPLEISEIGVHVAVGPSTPAPTSGGAAGSGGGRGGEALTPAQHEQIVSACVQQVMRNLRMLQDR
jgi:hypothetical protein